MGQDIYNAATNTRIGGTDWSQNWSGRADVQDLGQRTQNIPASPVSNLASNQPNVYDTSSLANTNVNIPPQTTNRYDNARNVLDSSISSTSNSLSSFLSQFDSYTKPAETERTGLVSKMNTAIDKLVGRGKRTQELMTEQQLPQNYEQLKALNLQIAEKKAAYDKSIQAIEGKNIPMPFITGQQAQVQKMANIELGNMATLAQALQGNIELSRQMVNDTVNLEYADTEQEIENLQYQLTLNEQNMTAAEKKRAEALSIALTDRQAQLDAEKQEKIDIKNVAIEAAKNGASSDLASRMMNAANLSEALKLGGSYLQSEDTQVVNAGGRQKLINTKTGAVIADLGYSQDTSPSIAEQLASDEAGFTIENGKIIPKDARTIVSQSGQSYDMSTYAADPAQAKAVQGYLNQIGKFNTVEDIDNYIKTVKPDSKVTGQMIANASTKYGIGWEELTALMQHESILATSNVAKNNNNPGGITWTQSYQDSHEGVSKGTARPKAEGGNYVKFATMQDGVNAVAQQLARRKVSATAMTDAEKIAQDIFNGNTTLNVSQYPTKQREAIETALTKLKQQAKESGDIEGIIKASAGGKDVAESFITSFDKAANVVYQIEDLQRIFDNEKLSSDYVDQQKKDTGVDLNPIWGKVRKFNPWDMDAQAIKAQLQAIVPNLARGIYGEVGVLTDNDIKNYAQTLPTLTSTEEVRKAVLGMTIRSVQRSIENKLKSQAASGRDVSGYLQMYTDIKGVADGLLSGKTTTNNTLSDEDAYQQYLQIIGQ